MEPINTGLLATQQVHAGLNTLSTRRPIREQPVHDVITHRRPRRPFAVKRERVIPAFWFFLEHFSYSPCNLTSLLPYLSVQLKLCFCWHKENEAAFHLRVRNKYRWLGIHHIIANMTYTKYQSFDSKSRKKTASQACKALGISLVKYA